MRRWRRTNVQVAALIESSDDSDNEVPNQVGDGENPVPNDVDEEILLRDSDDTLHTDEDSELIEDEEDFNTTSSDSLELSSDEDDINACNAEENVSFESELGEWQSLHKVTREALNHLLDILRKQGHKLPKDFRTLMKTPRQINSREFCGGENLYFGVETGLLKIVSRHSAQFSGQGLCISFNIDGVPLFKSTNVQLWPILCSVKGFEPFVVALFCGTSKPDSLGNYLSDFKNELCELKRNSVSYKDETFSVSFSAFVCDAPARSFLKCTKSFNGYYGCKRCVIKGRWNNRVIFHSDRTHTLRTDEKFKNFEYKEHQINLSPLVEIGVECIKGFPLDYMHLVCLGVMKRILMFFKQGPRECRLSQQQLNLLSSNLKKLNGKMPREFARQPRSLLYLDKWKATEFRQFLLYTGPLVLKSVLREEVYSHFLTLTVAMSILLESNQSKRNEYLNYAKELLQYFVEHSPAIYGDTFSTYNVHTLLHLPDDVQHFGTSLNEISAFQYENYLFKLKKYVRKSQNPIARIAKRMKETETFPSRRMPKKLHITISTKKKDSCFLLKNGKFAFVIEKRTDKRFLCDVFGQTALENLFENPCSSKFVNIVKLQNMRRPSRRMLLEYEDFERKAVCLPDERGGQFNLSSYH